MENENVVLITYRYMWKVEGSDTVNFKIVTDIPVSHEQFVNFLLEIDNLESACREYVCEYRVSNIGKFDTIKSKESSDNEAL